MTWLGVSFESGRPVDNARRRVVVTVLVFEVTESVLLATDLVDAFEDLTVSVPLDVVEYLGIPVRNECMLPVSSSAFAALTRGPTLPVPLGAADGDTGLNISSTESSSSANRW